MAEHSKKGAAKVRNLGRHKGKIALYYERTYPRTKLRHMLRSNGYAFAKAWAQKNGTLALLDKMKRAEDGKN